MKGEPEWMRAYRLKALEIYQSKPVPQWGANLEGLREDDMYFFVKPTDQEARFVTVQVSISPVQAPHQPPTEPS